jgi:cytosine/creatinine deaminase
MDLLIRNARLSDRHGEQLDIGVKNGRITAIEGAIAADARIYDARGLFACPGLIESHIHLDKSRIIDRCAPQERAKLSLVFGVTPVKKIMTVKDVHARAAATLEECVKHGTTRMRTQVEFDTGIGMRGFDGVEATKTAPARSGASSIWRESMTSTSTCISTSARPPMTCTST